jgi:hypothetical protein
VGRPQFHHCCNVQDRAAMLRLVGAGLVEIGQPLLGLTYFHATVAGYNAAERDGTAIARAMKG